MVGNVGPGLVRDHGTAGALTYVLASSRREVPSHILTTQLYRFDFRALHPSRVASGRAGNSLGISGLTDGAAGFVSRIAPQG